jgi:hypothetical protein
VENAGNLRYERSDEAMLHLCCTITSYACPLYLLAFPYLNQVENFGNLRYERSKEAMVHGRVLTQRHEATAAEEAMAEGERPLVSSKTGSMLLLFCDPVSTELQMSGAAVQCMVAAV